MGSTPSSTSRPGRDAAVRTGRDARTVLPPQTTTEVVPVEIKMCAANDGRFTLQMYKVHAKAGLVEMHFFRVIDKQGRITNYAPGAELVVMTTTKALSTASLDYSLFNRGFPVEEFATVPSLDQEELRQRYVSRCVEIRLVGRDRSIASMASLRRTVTSSGWKRTAETVGLSRGRATPSIRRRSGRGTTFDPLHRKQASASSKSLRTRTCPRICPTTGAS